MSLQTRLFAFFLGIVVIPLAIASFFGQRLIIRELERRTFEQLSPAQRAAFKVYDERVIGAQDRVRFVASEEALQRALVDKHYDQISGLLNDRLKEEGNSLDYFVVADDKGQVIGSALQQPHFLPGLSPPGAQEIVATDLPANRRLLVTRTLVPIRSPSPPNAVAWTVIGGYFLDSEFVSSLSDETGVDATVFIKQRAIASTVVPASNGATVTLDLQDRSAHPFFKSSLAGQQVYAVVGELGRDVPLQEAALVMSKPQSGVLTLKKTIQHSVWVVLGIAVILSGILGWALAKVIAGPLRLAAEGANEIAAGNYDQHIEVTSRDEVGRLASSFNEMARKLALHIADLRESREELKRAYKRFGETLRATHDMDNLLEVVLDTSIDTLSAKRGALLLSGARGGMSTVVSRGLDDGGTSNDIGVAVAAYVAESGEGIRFPREEGQPRLPFDLSESRYSTLAAVPLYSQERVIGVLVLYDKEDDENFSEADLGTLTSLGDQAGVAIENVLLHREAQKLAIMDGLTGIWNHRYFQMKFGEEIDRAERFGRPFTLILCDIDNFKVFNDTYGHQLGDSVLIELARRVKSVIRDIDWFARYGGEEFVLILPETDQAGGMRTAERIRQTIAAEAFTGDTINASVDVTVSIGVACFPEHGKERASLLRAADLAMYEAKRQGKNRVVMHRPDEAA